MNPCTLLQAHALCTFLLCNLTNRNWFVQCEAGVAVSDMRLGNDLNYDYLLTFIVQEMFKIQSST